MVLVGRKCWNGNHTTRSMVDTDRCFLFPFPPVYNDYCSQSSSRLDQLVSDLPTSHSPLLSKDVEAGITNLF